MLRFIACGSVDHGKSTLIGRLLYDSKQVFDDQLDALVADSRKFGTQGDALDFSLLLDGLAAEREQNITIDVAYRFFATARRKFIVIDAPGHEEYTANMATGASVADLALVLVAVERRPDPPDQAPSRDPVDARRPPCRARRQQDGSRRLVARRVRRDRDSPSAHWRPISVSSTSSAFRSRQRAAITSRAVPQHLPWYRGPSLLDYLETVEPARTANLDPFRMPIQWVNRPDADFRGYSGLITSGEVRVGMPVKILSAGRVTRVARIVTFDGDLGHATAGRSVTLTFTDPLDASRGDIVAEAELAPAVTKAG